jgi:type I restriction enzyme M protein
VADVDEITKNDCNLNITRYVDTAEEQAAVDLAGAIRKLRKLEKDRVDAEAKMNAFLEELGCGE